MAAYLTAIRLARSMGASGVVAFLKASLAEEQWVEQKLQKIAARLIKFAPTEG